MTTRYTFEIENNVIFLISDGILKKQKQLVGEMEENTSNQI